MNRLLKALKKECIAVDNSLKDKEAVLKKIATLGKGCSLLKDYSETSLFEKLYDREKIQSTGFGNDLAIPHCALDGIDEFIIGLLIVPDGVEFKAIDGKKSKVFVFIFAPASKRDDHIGYLSRISKVLRERSMIDELLAGQDSNEIYNLLRERIEFKEEPEFMTAKDHSLFHVIVQREDKFTDILQIFSEMINVHITVIEASNAGNYLNSLPLFASFWNENDKGFNKIIMAIVPRKLANEVLRQLKHIIDDPDVKNGILVFTNDLNYIAGSLNF